MDAPDGPYWLPDWELAITPWTRADDHPDPARRMTYYTGTGHPSKMVRSPVPTFIACSTLARYRTRGDRFPVRMGCPWAGDSGAYAALMMGRDSAEHPWSAEPDLYGSMWVRLIDDVGPPDFVAIQDWPCEPGVLARTGFTVAQHQEMTLDSYLHLAGEFDMVQWLPVLQGWHPDDYLRHFDAYTRAGVDLAGMHVGIGSVCRRGGQADIERVFRTLAPLGMRMHGFGVSINGLRRIGHLLASSDSQAWSATARKEQLRMPGCTHTALDRVTLTDCRNCFRYALAYREEVLAAVRTSWATPAHEQLDLFAA
jgi:hypothetical protein